MVKITSSALFDGRFFSVIKVHNNHILEARCKLCIPREIHIKGVLTSTSNFLKHLKTKHMEGFLAYQNYKIQVKNEKKAITNNDVKQKTLNEIVCASKHVSKTQIQQKFDNKLIRFICDCMVPTSIVEEKSFRDLFTDTSVTIMSRRALVRKIQAEYDNNIHIVKTKIGDAKYVCTTADIWSAKRRSFFGVTIHWVDDNFKRFSFALACRRFAGVHSFDRIADLLESIHLSYNLDNKKIVGSVTDNGSNFAKAFKEFGLKFVTSIVDEGQSSDSDDELQELSFETLNSEGDHEKYLPLPKHYRCASHTLNLLATSDANSVINSNASLRTKHEKVLKKCSILWNKASKPKSAEIIKAVLGHTLSYPCVTRWNSFYKSISQILEEKQKTAELALKLGLKDNEIMKDTDIQYLEEYCTILKPVAEALNFLQGQNYTFYGYLLPTILSLKVKLDRIKSEININNMKIVLNKIIESLLKRFAHLFKITEQPNSKDSIIAAVTIPSVKLRWLKIFQETDPTIDFSKMTKLIVEECVNLFSSNSLTESKASHLEQEQSDVPEFDFFDFKEDDADVPKNLDTHRSSQMTIQNKLELELLQYLEDKRTNIQMLNDYKMIKDIFIRYNTCLPSSAAVERLFSFATYINSPRRNALSDTLFEQLVIIKANGGLCET